jgi:hypothetical protein
LTNSGIKIDLKRLGISDSFKKIEMYDPWQNKWEKAAAEEMQLSLPDFKRSLVVRIEK